MSDKVKGSKAAIIMVKCVNPGQEDNGRALPCTGQTVSCRGTRRYDRRLLRLKMQKVKPSPRVNRQIALDNHVQPLRTLLLSVVWCCPALSIFVYGRV